MKDVIFLKNFYNGRQKLYQIVNEENYILKTGDGITINATCVLSSFNKADTLENLLQFAGYHKMAVDKILSMARKETLLFPADASGNVLSYCELAKYHDGHNHEQAMLIGGFRIMI